MPHRSYTSSSTTTASTWTECRNLLKGVSRASKNMRAEVKSLVGEVRRVENRLKELYGFRAHGHKVLEIGVGQLPRQIAYFAINNSVTGIDLDVIPQGFRIRQYIELGRTNGLKRLAKTVARKLLGMDHQFKKELKDVLHVEKLPSSTFIQMDATAMTFPDETFDLIYSFNVFEHLPDPSAVLAEMKRVLRPGGCIASHFHLFTSDSGCHDVRILSGDRDGLPYWPHLRKQHQHFVRNAAFINKLRIPEWKSIFDKQIPGQQLDCWQDTDYEALSAKLNSLRAHGELREYSDEELLSRIVVSYWQKKTSN